MKRNTHHIHPGPDEDVVVHPRPTPSPGEDWWVGPLLKVGGAILAFWVICLIIKALLPFIVLGVLGWFGLQVFGKWGNR